MSDRASLLWESTSATASVASDLSLNTLQVWKTSPAPPNANITGPGDYVNATIYCEGDLACKNTLWAGRLRANTRLTTSDWRAKLKHTKRTEFLNGIRQIDVYSYYYRTDTPKDTTLGVMAHQLLPVFPELVEVPSNQKHYMAVNYDGLSAVCLGGVKELDAQVQTMSTQVERLKDRCESLEHDLRTQAARLREQDDRMRAQDDRTRALEERMRVLSLNLT